jgi:quercetin dioxygenase-like cupin family protein
MKKLVCIALGILAVSLGLAFGARTVSAEDVAPSYIASPDVYKLISENEHFRVITATWKPGQRDKWHSHAGPLTGYRLTDCKLRAYTPDGKFKDREAKRGEVLYNPVIASHSVENIGLTDCQVLIVEKK